METTIQSNPMQKGTAKQINAAANFRSLKHQVQCTCDGVHFSVLFV